MPKEKPEKITVYYDGACPSCVRDRENYEKLSSTDKDQICWLDITGKDALLIEKGIDPKKALTELHIEIEGQGIISEMDAYRVLMSHSTLLKPLAWLLSIAFIKKLVSKIYHWQVKRRLKRQGRL